MANPQFRTFSKFKSGLGLGIRWWPLLLIGGMIGAALVGCDGDKDYTRIDFSETSKATPPNLKKNQRPILRFAVGAMISPRETAIYYQELMDYLAAGLECDAQLVQRKTYKEINELLAKKRIDLAFICTGPYAGSDERFELEAIATPLVRGQPFYHAYLIVHKDSHIQSIADLRGKDFAFTDPDSNTGALVPRYWLRQMGERPETFFRNFIYTYSHDNAIMAVAKHLVDGASVDSLIWEFYQQRNPFYSSKTRVIKTSMPFGSPPVVVSRALDPKMKNSLSQILLTMHQSPDGKGILDKLMIDAFVPSQPQWYVSVKSMIHEMGDGNLIDDETQ